MTQSKDLLIVPEHDLFIGRYCINFHEFPKHKTKILVQVIMVFAEVDASLLIISALNNLLCTQLKMCCSHWCRIGLKLNVLFPLFFDRVKLNELFAPVQDRFKAKCLVRTGVG